MQGSNLYLKRYLVVAMEINPYAVPPAISIVVHLVFIGILLKRSRSRQILKAFLPFFSSALLWAISEFIVRSFVVTPENYLHAWSYPYALFFGKLSCIGVIGIFLTGVYLSFIFPMRKIGPKEEKILVLFMVVSLLVISPVILFTDAMVERMVYYWAGYGNDFGPLLTYLLFPLFVFVGVLFYNFITSYIDARTKIERSQIKLIAIGTGIFAVTSLPTGVFSEYFAGSNFPVYGVPSGTFYILFLDAFVMYAAVRYKLFTVEAVVEEKPEELVVPESAAEIRGGDVVLVVSPDGENGFEIFRGITNQMPGLCITTKHPEEVRINYGFTKIPIIWLSEITTKEMAIEPLHLDFEISYHVFTFAREGEKRAIYIDDVDYLISVNGYEAVRTFLSSAAEETRKRNSVLIFSTTMAGLNEEERNNLKEIATLEIFQDRPRIKKPGAEFSVKEGNAILVEALGERREAIKSKISGYKVLGVSAHFPKKFRRGFPESTDMECIWITETTSYERAISARRMEFEALREILNFVRANQGKGLVYLDAIPAFLITNEFSSVLKFVKDIVDFAKEHRCKVVFEIPPDLFKPAEKTLFERRMDAIYTDAF
ncbi:MAG: DUF835 domain-containing protein [Thermoplasmata archaeon]|nr:DUF835 domain-containing protein [Thermoplasmata archaeon]